MTTDISFERQVYHSTFNTQHSTFNILPTHPPSSLLPDVKRIPCHLPRLPPVVRLLGHLPDLVVADLRPRPARTRARAFGAEQHHLPVLVFPLQRRPVRGGPRVVDEQLVPRSRRRVVVVHAHAVHSAAAAPAL